MFVLFAVLLGLVVPALASASPHALNEVHPFDSHDVSPLPDLDTASPQELFVEGWRRIDLGDHRGSRIIAEEILTKQPEEHHEEALYLLAVGWDLAGEDEQGLEVLETIRAMRPQGHRYDDATFRSALILGALKQPKTALRHLRKLKPWRRLSEPAQQKIALCRGVWVYEKGRLKPGLRKIVRALDTVSEGSVSWFQGLARTSIVEVLLNQSNALHFNVVDYRLETIWRQRAELLLASEAQLRATMALEEPEWILTQLWLIGHAYEDVASDLEVSPLPDLPPGELVRYRGQTQELISNQLVKATQLYELGIDLAVRLAWRGDIVDDLYDSRDDVRVRVESM